jgi:hypothetical protein
MRGALNSAPAYQGGPPWPWPSRLSSVLIGRHLFSPGPSAATAFSSSLRSPHHRKVPPRLRRDSGALRRNLGSPREPSPARYLDSKHHKQHLPIVRQGSKPHKGASMTHYGSFMRHSPSFRSEASSLRSEASSFRSEASSLRSEAPSFRSEASSLRSEASSFRSEAPSSRSGASSFG